MTTTVEAVALPDGTRYWAKSQRRQHSIALTRYTDGSWEVYALDGHELLPVTHKFAGTDAEANARAWANTVWARY